MTSPTDATTRRPGLVPTVLGAVLAATLLTGGGAVWVLSGGEKVLPAAAAAEPVPDPVLTATAPSGPRSAAPWDAPLELRVTEGTLKDVTVLGPDGAALDGALIDPATWRSTELSLLPAATYRVTASVADPSGSARPMTLAVQTTPATRVLHAVVSPGDGAVVGIGQPLVVVLDHAVKAPQDRAAVVARLKVVTSPAVEGAWRWMENNELHYRGPAYWAAGTTISLQADLRRLKLSGGTWGSGNRSTSYRIGDAIVSSVDVNTHLMMVRRNGVVVRTVKVSTGRDEYPTHNGVHIVLSKTKLKTMDSTTIGIPRNGPGGYFLKVPNSVRISNSGEFVHSAPGTVRQQGVANVSHGCVNLSPADAAWFFGLVKRGDVVEVRGSPRKPISYDPGTSDWNIPFSDWAN